LTSKNQHHPQVLQDYLEALADSAEALSPSDQKLLYGYAELKYRMAGGGKCPLCRAPVRHVVPVFSKRENGDSVAYDCLCQRCLLGEVGMATEVELRIGEACVRYTRNLEDKQTVTRTFVAPNKPPNGSN
jgi:hypothetical protein